MTPAARASRGVGVWPGGGRSSGSRGSGRLRAATDTQRYEEVTVHAPPGAPGIADQAIMRVILEVAAGQHLVPFASEFVRIRIGHDPGPRRSPTARDKRVPRRPRSATRRSPPPRRSRYSCPAEPGRTPVSCTPHAARPRHGPGSRSDPPARRESGSDGRHPYRPTGAALMSSVIGVEPRPGYR